MDFVKRSNITYSFPKPDLTMLRDLMTKSTPDNKIDFRERYGWILSFVHRMTEDEHWAVHTLLQFYDPPLRCFTFMDYQLAPMLEEFSQLLNVPILKEVPFHTSLKIPNEEEIAAALYLSASVVKTGLKKKGGLLGFPLEFLVKEAGSYACAGGWNVYNAILALCVYGIVLFPNIPDFVDENAIRIFMSKNPVPTLLGDVYYSVHSRNYKKKGGLVRCCAPLLYKWFMSHLPHKGAFVEVKGMKWSEKIMGLEAKDIFWINRTSMGKDLIYSCGEFPNVPLMGIRGGINYNPALARRQFGYAMRIPPTDNELKESVFYDATVDIDVMKKVATAWNTIKYRGKDFWDDVTLELTQLTWSG